MDEALTYLLGRFEKIRCLHKTPRGEVWLGADAAGRPVIYKRLRRTGLPLAKLQALAHPLWPEVYAFVEAAGETHVLEEYVQGEPMTRRLETGRYLTEREACSIARRRSTRSAATPRSPRSCATCATAAASAWRKVSQSR